MPHDETAHDAPRGSGLDDGDVSALEDELQTRGEPYARATVVRREPPVSANVGDRAVVTQDGELHGWVGGVSCAQSVVAEEAREAIAAGEPRLIGIAPDPATVDRPGLDAFPMRCHSDGVLEIFLEPVARTELVVVGDSPVARSLARMADELAVDVTLVVADGDAEPDVPAGTNVLATVEPSEIADAVGRSPVVVVASMGGYDARGVAAGVLADAPYVGLVASDERATEEVERAAGLLDRDPEGIRSAVTNPAGVDIDAHTPAELAASLLAEVVDVRSRGSVDDDAAASEDADAAADHGGHDHDDHSGHDHSDGGGHDHGDDGHEGDETDADGSDAAVDPVCGMTVDPDDAAASVEYGGETYHFCCHGCADSFESEPAEYVAEVEP
ncbi:XdhC family protein [Halostella salina]|uniref:XdhC family protein n=1 Tax=Halostella salina TaxID=1547897 RepID=UPI000EF7F1E7|nr:XdhC family protein [Halostella salina]